VVRPEFVRRKLHLIAEDLGRLLHFRDDPLEALTADFVRMAAVERLIARSAGLRNILVHDYNDVDRKIVHASVRSCLEDYRRYVEFIDAFLERGME
jgi:uncharacterized protein YutE (UPF0331/DUF86 family)